MQQKRLINNSSQLNIFRAIILPETCWADWHYQ